MGFMGFLNYSSTGILRTYYNGFVKPFVIKSEMNLLYYVTDASKDIEENNLWVLFFYYKSNNKEMMICNFDSRRNIPYAFEGGKEIGHHIDIMPYNEFLTHLRNRKKAVIMSLEQKLIIGEK